MSLGDVVCTASRLLWVLPRELGAFATWGFPEHYDTGLLSYRPRYVSSLSTSESIRTTWGRAVWLRIYSAVSEISEYNKRRGIRRRVGGYYRGQKIAYNSSSSCRGLGRDDRKKSTEWPGDIRMSSPFFFPREEFVFSLLTFLFCSPTFSFRSRHLRPRLYGRFRTIKNWILAWIASVDLFLFLAKTPSVVQRENLRSSDIFVSIVCRIILLSYCLCSSHLLLSASTFSLISYQVVRVLSACLCHLYPIPSRNYFVFLFVY